MARHDQKVADRKRRYIERRGVVLEIFGDSPPLLEEPLTVDSTAAISAVERLKHYPFQAKLGSSN